ncbi:MAG: DUF6362 family protein [Alphaproteobacteria bacterium]
MNARINPNSPRVARLADGTPIEFWDAASVQARLEEMGQCLRRMRVPGLRPSGYVSKWPDHVRGYWAEFSAAVGRGGTWEQVRLRPIPPAPAAIDRMDECFEWFHLVEHPDTRRIIWMHALGIRRKSIAAAFGRDRQTIWRWYRHGLQQIVAGLNQRLAVTEST